MVRPSTRGRVEEIAEPLLCSSLLIRIMRTMSETRSIDGVKDLARAQYPPVGRCIYCGGADGPLTREHIVPYALCTREGGTGVLPQAACTEHARVTGRVERTVLRGPMWPVRVLRQLKSRTRHEDAPRTQRLTVVRNGIEEEVDLPLAEYPVILHFYKFDPPAFLAPGEYKSGIRLSGHWTISFGPKPDDVARKLGASSISISLTDQPVAFARMIAKIAFAMAVAERLVEPADPRVGVLPSILGQEDQIGRWVGTFREPSTRPGLLHGIGFHQINGLLVSEVQLFADSQTPSYGVVLRRL